MSSKSSTDFYLFLLSILSLFIIYVHESHPPYIPSMAFAEVDFHHFLGDKNKTCINHCANWPITLYWYVCLSFSDYLLTHVAHWKMYKIDCMCWSRNICYENFGSNWRTKVQLRWKWSIQSVRWCLYPESIRVNQ